MPMATNLKKTFPARLAFAYGQSKAGNYAAGLAFNAYLTMFPLLLGILTIIGLAIHDPGTEQKLQETLVGVFPPDAHSQLMQGLKGVKHSAGALGLVSTLGLVWTGTGLFAAMEFALTQVFGTKQRDPLRQRLMGLVMMVVFVFAIVVAVSANNASAFLPFMPFTGLVVGAVILVGLLMAIYRFVPNRTFRVSEILPGALLAGLLVEVLTLVFPLYARLAHGFNTYGQQFALFFLLATWLYLLSQLLLLGAVFNRLRLGAPQEEGLAATPGGEGSAVPSPVTAIEDQQAETERASRRKESLAPEPSEGGGHRKPRQPLLRQVMGFALRAVLVAQGMLAQLPGRRRRSVA